MNAGNNTSSFVLYFAFLQIIARRPFQERPQLARARRMPKLAQRLGFNLADALARDGEGLAHLLQRMLAAVVQAKAHLDDFFFARRQRLQHRRSLLLQIQVDDRIRGRHHGLVLDEVPKMRILFLTNRRFQRNGFLRDLQDLAHLGDRDVHAFGNFLAGGLAAKLLHQLPAGAHQFVDGLDHVHGNTNGARLIGDGARDGLADPPGRVGRELVAAAPFEFIHGLHQADVAFLNEVQKLQPAVGVFLGDGHNEPQVRFDQFFLGLFRFRFAALNNRQGTLQFGQPDLAGVLDVLQLRAPGAQLAAGFRGVLALGYVRAALQAARFALQGLQPLDRAAHLVHKALFLERVEVDATDFQGNSHTRASDGPLRADVRPLLRFRRVVELDRLLQGQFVELGNLVDVLERLLGFVGDLFFGELFVVKLNDFLDGPRALPQVIPDRDQFLDHDGRARDGLHHHQLAALDALGDGHFAFAREQGHGAHFAEVHAHWVVGFFQRAGRQVQVAAFFRVGIVLDHRVVIALLDGHFHGARRFGRRGVFIDLDSIALESRQQVVDFFRRMDFRGERVVDLIVQQVAALLADGNELLYRIIFFFQARSRHNTPPALLTGYFIAGIRRASLHTPRTEHERTAQDIEGEGCYPPRSYKFFL